jgi:hypothetical protein
MGELRIRLPAQSRTRHPGQALARPQVRVNLQFIQLLGGERNNSRALLDPRRSPQSSREAGKECGKSDAQNRNCN